MASLNPLHAAAKREAAAGSRLCSRIAQVLLDSGDEAFCLAILKGLASTGFDINAPLAPTTDIGYFAMPASLPFLAAQLARRFSGASQAQGDPLVEALGSMGAQWNVSDELSLSPMSQAAAQQNLPALKSMARHGGCWLGLASASGCWERPGASPLIHLAGLPRGRSAEFPQSLFNEIFAQAQAELEGAISAGLADPKLWIPSLAVALLGSLDALDPRADPPHFEWRSFWAWAASLCADFSIPLCPAAGEATNFANTPTLDVPGAGLSFALAVEAGRGNPSPLLLGAQIAGIRPDPRSMWAFSAPWNPLSFELGLSERLEDVKAIASTLSAVRDAIPEFLSCGQIPAHLPASGSHGSSLAQSCGEFFSPAIGEEPFRAPNGKPPKILHSLVEAINAIRSIELDANPAAAPSWQEGFVSGFSAAASAACLHGPASRRTDTEGMLDFGAALSNCIDSLACLAKSGPPGKALAGACLGAWISKCHQAFDDHLLWELSADDEAYCFAGVFANVIFRSIGAGAVPLAGAEESIDEFLASIDHHLNIESFPSPEAADSARAARSLYEQAILGSGPRARSAPSTAKTRRI